jgi:hypothetical protein
MHHGKIIDIGRPQELIEKYHESDLQETFIQLISRRGSDA